MSQRERLCKFCGEPVDDATRGRYRDYCSDLHYSAHKRRIYGQPSRERCPDCYQRLMSSPEAHVCPARGVPARAHRFDARGPAARPGSTSERCRVVGCDRIVHAKGLCSAHYSKERRAEQQSLASGWNRGLVVDFSWNPFAHRVRCPSCKSAEATMPWHPGSSRWRCINPPEDGNGPGCGTWFDGPLYEPYAQTKP